LRTSYFPLLTFIILFYNFIQKHLLVSCPPAVGEDFHFIIAVKTCRFCTAPDLLHRNTAFAHQSPVVKKVNGGTHPVTDMEGIQVAVATTAQQLLLQIRIPPEMVNICRYPNMI